MAKRKRDRLADGSSSAVGRRVVGIAKPHIGKCGLIVRPDKHHRWAKVHFDGDNRVLGILCSHLIAEPKPEKR